MSKMTEDQINQMINLYQQIYFTHDEPVPFKQHLKIYPVLITDYYKFHSVINLFTQNKNEDPTGKGIMMSHLDYLLEQAKGDTQEGRMITYNIISLLELIFKIQNGFKCYHCGQSVISWDEIHEKLSEIEKSDEFSQNQNRDEYILKIFQEIKKCPICEKEREEIIRFNPLSNGKRDIIVDGVEITKDDYDILRKIVPYQNMPDYDDEYIDPDLKADLEEQARLENPKNVTPSLEKQESCIIAATSYTYETIKQISLRHLVILLRTVDTKLHYFCYRQAEASGMVKFEKEIDHWIYSQDKKSKAETMQTLESFKDKMSNVAAM